MPVRITLRVPGVGPGNRARWETSLTVDYVSVAELPELVVFERKLWSKVSGTTYGPFSESSVPVDLEAAGKIIEA